MSVEGVYKQKIPTAWVAIGTCNTTIEITNGNLKCHRNKVLFQALTYKSFS